MMPNHTQDFQLTHGQIWLNAASEGPIPTVSAGSLLEAIQWKLSPHRLTIPKFIEVPLELKRSLAKLINVNAEDIILGNSATYGIHLLSHGLDLKSGDEVILMRNDFPTDILPWLHLADKGVKVTQLQAKGPVLTPEEIRSAITSRTKAVCLPMVHSFSGWSLDIEAIGALCRERNISFIVNMSQVVGAWPLDLSVLPIDAIVCAGYKWLLGPYGTGFCWLRPGLRKELHYDQAYWIALMDEHSLNSDGELSLVPKDSARQYDVFGTANFFNFVPWRASIEYLLTIGIDVVKVHNDALVDQIHQDLDQVSYDIISPVQNNERTTIVVVTHKDKSRNKAIFDRLKENGVHVAFWRNNIRISPHIYNTPENIGSLLSLLNTRGE